MKTKIMIALLSVFVTSFLWLVLFDPVYFSNQSQGAILKEAEAQFCAHYDVPPTEFDIGGAAAIARTAARAGLTGALLDAETRCTLGITHVKKQEWRK